MWHQQIKIEKEKFTIDLELPIWNYKVILQLQLWVGLQIRIIKVF